MVTTNTKKDKCECGQQKANSLAVWDNVAKAWDPGNFDEKHMKSDAERASGKGASSSTQGADHSGNPQGRPTPARDGYTPLYGRNADLEATTIRAKSREITRRIQAGEEILDDWQDMICDPEYVRREERNGYPDTVDRPKGSTICRYHAVGRICRKYDACHFAHTLWPEEIRERMKNRRAQERAQRDQDREQRTQGPTANYQPTSQPQNVAPLPRREILLPHTTTIRGGGDVSITQVGYETRQALPGAGIPGWSDTSPVYPATHYLGGRPPPLPPPPSLPPPSGPPPSGPSLRTDYSADTRTDTPRPGPMFRQSAVPLHPPPNRPAWEAPTGSRERLLQATPKQPPQGGQQYYQTFSTQHQGEQQTTAAQPQQHNYQQNTWAGAPQQARQHQEPMSTLWLP